MRQVPNFGDERQTGFCVYCGGRTETRDHVPSRIFLDEPYPQELPVVPACKSCNSSFSMDEEYLACLIDCVQLGSVVGSSAHRPKVERILKVKPALVSRLARARKETSNGVVFDVEDARAKNVVLKLARGHAAFELNEPQLEVPSAMIVVPLPLLSDAARREFETHPASSVWPEVGSRAMHRAALGTDVVSGWVIVQQGRYRYLAEMGGNIIIRMVIGEYLGCEVVWDF